MRVASLALTVAIVSAIPANAATPAPADFASRNDVMEWIDQYRHHPEPARLPAAVKTLSKSLVLREPATAGFYAGFVAGVLGADSKNAEHLVQAILPLPPADQWLMVRAIAYSGLPAWQSLLARVTDKLPARRGMIDAYLLGKLPTLDKIKLDKSPTFLEQVEARFGREPPAQAMSYSRNPELLDTLWGEYFATGRSQPIERIVAILPWSKDRDDGARLTAGSAAKVTLANNAERYPDIMAMLKRMQPGLDEGTRPIVADVIRAAETANTGGIRSEQLALLDKLKTKGAGYQRDMTLWGYVGQGVIGVTCVTLAALSLTAAGIPCVIGGAATSAVLTYWTAK